MQRGVLLKYFFFEYINDRQKDEYAQYKKITYIIYKRSQDTTFPPCLNPGSATVLVCCVNDWLVADVYVIISTQSLAIIYSVQCMHAMEKSIHWCGHPYGIDAMGNITYTYWIHWHGNWKNKLHDSIATMQELCIRRSLLTSIDSGQEFGVISYNGPSVRGTF